MTNNENEDFRSYSATPRSKTRQARHLSPANEGQTAHSHARQARPQGAGQKSSTRRIDERRIPSIAPASQRQTRPASRQGQTAERHATRNATAASTAGSNNPRLKAQAQGGPYGQAPSRPRTANRAQNVRQNPNLARKGNAAAAMPANAAQRAASGMAGQIPEKKRTSKGKKIAVGIVATLLVLVLGVGAAGAAYYNSIKNSLGYDGDSDALKDALSLANYADPFYVLVIGSDNWESYGARSDAMILARVDLNKAQVTMVSIPRDTPYQINGQTVKLNQVFAEQGEIACIEAVSELTGVDISHYVEVEFDQLESVVDSLGGVKVNVPYSFDYQVYTKDEPVVHVDAGEQVLTGQQAVAFARMRTAYSDVGLGEDAIRQANIRAMMVGMIKQILNQPIADIPGQIQKLAAMVKTDIPLDELINWATALAKADEVTLYSCTGPTDGGIDDSTGLWLTEEAPEQWAALMKVVDSGQDPSAVLDAGASSDGQMQLNTTETI